MNTSELYLPDFPNEHKIKDVDIVTLYREKRFDELNSVIVCKNKDGDVTATFGQDSWNCLPFSRKKSKNTLSFNDLKSHPELQRELKLISWGWLFNKSPKKQKALKFSGVESRLADFKRVYRFLAENNLCSIKTLSFPSVWRKFEAFLQENEYAQRTIELTFAGINATVHYSAWHKLDIDIDPIKSKREAARLSHKEEQQTLVIPERLCDEIYGKAIKLVEGAYPHRHLIADTMNSLQVNYLDGKQILDHKIKQGITFSFMNPDGSVNNRKYTTAISENQPQKPIEIISPLTQKLSEIPLKNGGDFKRYLGQLTCACYIVCGGFSGMRDSELDKLTPNSYYKDTFEGRDFHLLQSHTFKLGEKRETWVTASSSKTAISLMSVLTEQRRKETDYPDQKYKNSIWVSQTQRSRPPILISDWNNRLRRFCQQYGFIVTKEDFQECLECNPRSLKRVSNNVVVGEPWPMSTHQFRRTLAFYCIKNRLGTLISLKQQFKHLYLAMTEWYTNGGKLASLRSLKVDEKIQNALDEINAETTANKIFKQWHSDEKLSGTHGKAIIKMRGDVPTIYSSWDVIYKAVKDGKLTLHGSMHSYCKSGYNCDMDGVITPQFCVECGSGSSIIDGQQAKWWQKRHRSLVAYMASGEEISVSEHSHYVTQVRAAEKVMTDFDMPFTPFETDLKVTNL
ncbi:hypothetical protein WD347_003512 [Vibrio parahaemolyticus]|jgi:hypothetical protein|uniref:hypothetical protein n=1 Tax=Vibrio parahaemolyticus TaxID=670 RepID=UPI00038E4521|nr:hypothetical protein [Vibrio parahaemolyticus]EJG0922567.1 hypothetical protein [Vibrio parahaemolyticus O1:K68]EJG0932282.1 hypothetical protein [Vibrio parahaemolyticus O1]EJG0946589.1 hypothetical protein [Vibrio parahaemolyticus O10]EQM42674.1 hypothetical protein D051_4538 [Vibrio parahaemolyticus VPCR-2010]EGQ9064175.1 hypothetical protein [Vibrio parahaemolyticus]